MRSDNKTTKIAKIIGGDQLEPMGVRVCTFAMALAECRGRPRASPMARRANVSRD